MSPPLFKIAGSKELKNAFPFLIPISLETTTVGSWVHILSKYFPCLYRYMGINLYYLLKYNYDIFIYNVFCIFLI